MSGKVLTVSIAGYNVEKTLTETLEPFLNCRELRKMEIVIVNDGSKDNTEEIALRYVHMYPHIFHLIHKENGGWGSTINAGVQFATGKYFKQLDGDDYYDYKNLDLLIRLLERVESDLVITPYISFDDRTGKRIAEHNCNPGYKQKKEYQLSDIKNFQPFMHALCVKTELIKDTVRITEHCFYTDTEFVLKTINQVQTVMFFDKPIYYYRRASSGQSMSMDGFEKHHLEQHRVIRELLRYRKQSVNRQAVLDVFDRLLFGTCMWYYLILLYLRPSLQHRKELIEFDKMLKSNAREYYDRTDIGTILKLRKTGFLGYSVAALLKKKKDNRFAEDGRMLF